MPDMNIHDFLKEAAQRKEKRPLPILSFPAASKIGVSVGELVKNSLLQAKAMEYISKETSTLAEISFMDLSVEAEAFGAQVRFSDDEVPVIIGQLVCDMDGAEALEVPSLESGRAPIYIESIRLAKERITDKPLLAGMIGPYSLAGRLMDVTEIMYLCFDEPETVHEVLKKATQYLISYGGALKKAGANGIMIA
jgi:uroporphyrinogen decarboxylase